MKIRNPNTGDFETIYVKVGDNIPVGAEFEYDGTTIPEGYEKVEDEEDKGEIYSTEEIKIGTWIDGKPLYRKTWTFYNITISSAAVNLINVEDFDGDTVLIDEGASYWTIPSQTQKMFVPLNHYSSSSDWQQTWCYLNNIRTMRGNSIEEKLVITLKYTKTTDEGGNV